MTKRVEMTERGETPNHCFVINNLNCLLPKGYRELATYLVVFVDTINKIIYLFLNYMYFNIGLTIKKIIITNDN